MKVGYCKYCHESRMVETDIDDQELVNAMATEECTCAGASHARKLFNEKNTAEAIIDNYFGGKYPEAAELLKMAIEPVQTEAIKSITIQVCPKIKANLSKTTKDSIKVKRTFTQTDEEATE